MDIIDSTQTKPIITWDIVDIFENYANIIMDEENVNEEVAYERAYNDPDLLSLEWEWLLGILDEMMNEINPSNNTWYVDVNNFGWKKLSGEMTFEASNGKDLLEKILPNCECSFKIYKHDNYISINNAHHDSPAWNEWYHIYMAKEIEDARN